MKLSFKRLVVLLLSLIAFSTYPLGYAEELKWIEMETTENITIPNLMVQERDSGNFSERIQKILKDAKVTTPGPAPTVLRLKEPATVSADTNNSIAVTIEEIKKRRQEDDALLSKLLEKQKEQEQQQKELERKKLVDEVLAAQQRKQKDDENKLAAVLREINEQQAKLQTERDKQQADQNKSVLEILQLFKTQQETQQQTLNDLKPQHFVSNSAVNIIPLDDPQYAKKSIHQYIAENTQDAKEAPSREADVSFFYSSGALFKIYCKEGFLTDIQLQPNEEVQYINGGDTVRWIVEKAQSGSGKDRIWHIYLKPIQTGLETNIVINTDKHSYQIQAQSTNWYNPIVRWNYPHEQQAAFFRQQAKETKLQEDEITMAPSSPDKLNFNYNIKGKTYTWTPIVAFDDGTKTYIKMPATLATGEAPVLFIKDKKQLKMVNYRIKNNYYIVDRLFKEAELRVGEDAVRIKQN